jgi:peptidoglycan/LPS O-acetylase OafA/YrhL
MASLTQSKFTVCKFLCVTVLCYIVEMAGCRNLNLDALRGLASVYVFISHFSNGYYGRYSFFGCGSLGVVMFFLLSGYIMTEVYFVRWLHATNKTRFYLVFMFNRLCRIMPMVWVSTLLFRLPLYLLKQTDWVTMKSSLVQLVLCGPLLMPNEFRPDETWTLGVEFCFYILLPVYFVVCSKTKSVSWVCVAIASSLSIGLYIWFTYFLFRFDPYRNPWLRLHQFAVGVVLHPVIHGRDTSWLHNKVSTNPELYFWAVTCVCFFSFLFSDSFFILPLLAAQLWIAASVCVPSLESILMQFLGRISYPLYLIHVPIIKLFHIEIVLTYAAPDNINIDVAVMVLITVLLAYALHLSVEVRLYAYLKWEMPLVSHQEASVCGAVVVSVTNETDQELSTKM